MLTDKKNHSSDPEIWGGIECTINRVGDEYFDQLSYADHYVREGDTDTIAELGFKAFRYPVLWEQHEKEEGEEPDFSFAKKNIHALRKKNIQPIIGLVHHGSGPAFTNLLDKNFGKKLAAYAAKVAQAFPEAEYYTPVNEPLTTARFSALYGLWYPHKNDGLSFAYALLNQLKGIVLSMKAIRKVNPNAKLIQTEDLGKIYSTPKLKYQADFENERRWLTNDILCGKLNSKHKLRRYFQTLGVKKKDLDFFIENPCPPDIIGWNYYITSERFLDQRIKRYPAHTHGGNHRHTYADVEAVRVPMKQPHGLAMLLREAWVRYQRPMAITEAHLHCTREEQLRWFKYVFNTAAECARQGIDIRAVTAWSVLGAFGWNKLLTVPNGEYEPGVFDIRSGSLRTTALANYIKQKNNAPYLNEAGWWQRPSRILYGSKSSKLQLHSFIPIGESTPLLIIGKNGTLGKAFKKIADERCIYSILISREECELSNANAITDLIHQYHPWAIINAAGFVRVDDAEQEYEKCFADNCVASTNLAEQCAKHHVKLISFSSDLVFDGNQRSPYTEADTANPLNVYGRTKADAEVAVASSNPDALIIRTSAFFGPWDEFNFAHAVINALEEGKEFHAANDLIISPTYVPDLVHTCLDLLIDNEKGVWHLANEGECSWYTFAKMIAAECGLNDELIVGVPHAQFNWPAPRPAYSVLRSAKGNLLPSLQNAIERFALLKAPNRTMIA